MEFDSNDMDFISSSVRVCNTVTAGKWHWNIIVFHWAWMWKEIRRVHSPLIGARGAALQTLKTAFRGGSATKSCGKGIFPGALVRTWEIDTGWGSCRWGRERRSTGHG